MLKNADKVEASSHFTYDEYRKKVKKGPNKDVLVFLSVFVFSCKEDTNTEKEIEIKNNLSNILEELQKEKYHIKYAVLSESCL